MKRYKPLFESKLDNELIIMKTGNHKFPVYVNPTKQQYWALIDRFKDDYPNAPKGEVKIRSTYSEMGDTFQWMALDSDHYQVEKYILERFNLETNQAWG